MKLKRFCVKILTFVVVHNKGERGSIPLFTIEILLFKKHLRYSFGQIHAYSISANSLRLAKSSAAIKQLGLDPYIIATDMDIAKQLNRFPIWYYQKAIDVHNQAK